MIHRRMDSAIFRPIIQSSTRQISAAERNSLVEEVGRLATRLGRANGDSSADGRTYREMLMAHLRSLAIPLWTDWSPGD
jgi:hypothetical protein